MLDAAAGASAAAAVSGGALGAADTWEHTSPIRTAAVAWQQSAFMISPDGTQWGNSPIDRTQLERFALTFLLRHRSAHRRIQRADRRSAGMRLGIFCVSWSRRAPC